MATTFDSRICVEVGWTWRDRVGEAPIVDSNRHLVIRNLPDGRETGQADAVWHCENQTLAAGETRTLELDWLEQTLFGDLVAIPLAKVKVLSLVNKSTPEGGYLLVGGASENPWDAPFGGPDHAVKVMPGSPMVLVHLGEGWEVEASRNALRLAAVGGPVVFDIAVVGVLAQTPSS